MQKMWQKENLGKTKMRAYILGIILLIIGLIITDYGLQQSYWFSNMPLILTGMGITLIGLWILAMKFRQWVISH